MMKENKKWLDTVIFSGTIALFTVLCAILFEAHDADFNWYCVLGKNIVEGNSNFNGADFHSWIAQERGGSQIQHSWLGTVIAYGFSCLFSKFDYAVIAFIAFTAFIHSFVTKTLFLNRIKLKPFFNLVVSVFAIYTIVSSTFLARTRSFDCILFTIVYYLLFVEIKPIIKIACFSLISVLWVNLHGSSILLYFAVLFIFAVINRIPDFQVATLIHRQNKKESNTLLVVSIISFIMGLLNPYGIKMYGYAIFNNTGFVKEGVAEWSSAALLNVDVIICLLLFAINFVFLSRKADFKNVFAVVMFLGMTGIYIRMNMFLYIASLYFFIDIIKNIDEKCDKPVFSKRLPVNLLCGIVSFMICAETIPLIKKYEYYSVSNDLITYLKTENFERTYNDYNLGAYLIFYGLQDFVDARADFFDEETLTGAKKFASADFAEKGEMQEFLDTFCFDSVILNTDCGVTIDYLLSNDWRIAFEDTRENKGMNYVVLVPKQ